jgi:nicotinamide mononucleotide (NMN) deamidase PncC
MDVTTYRLIEAIHHAPTKCVLAVTGGGTGAVAQLLGVPGGSRTILEAVVPYHEQALAEFLGYAPENYCSADTSRAMARRARDRGRWLLPGEAVVGIGGTASLATDRPKRGEHRFHLSVAAAATLRTYSLTFRKDARARAGEESILDVVLLNALAEACGIAERLPLSLFPDEQLQAESESGLDPLARLLGGELTALCCETDGRLRADAPRPGLLLPGSFNPLHEGHCQLCAAAERLTGLAGAFELSVVNVDKPPLGPEEVRRRLQAFAWKAPVWLTRAPTFAEKALLFPGAAFVVGADTAARIVEPRYYQSDAALMTAALERIQSQGCRFLVAGRAVPGGKFLTLADLAILESHRELFTPIPESEFRADVSSTALRGERGAPISS